MATRTPASTPTRQNELAKRAQLDDRPPEGNGSETSLAQPVLIGRTAAAGKLGMSVSTFRRKVEGKVLQPVTDGRGWHLFHVDQIEQVRETVLTQRRVIGEQEQATPALDRATHGRVLELLDAGKNVVDVARELELYVEEVEPIFEKWLKYRRSVFLNNMQIDAIWDHAEKYAGFVRMRERDDPEELVAAVQKIAEAAETAEAPHRCKRCRKHKAAVCLNCSIT